jgi:hypothetical protein
MTSLTRHPVRRRLAPFIKVGRGGRGTPHRGRAQEGLSPMQPQPNRDGDTTVVIGPGQTEHLRRLLLDDIADQAEPSRGRRATRPSRSTTRCT